MTPQSLHTFTAEHRHLLAAAAQAAGFDAPLAINLGDYQAPLIDKARKGPTFPVDDVLVRGWNSWDRKGRFRLGMRLYEIEGIRFVCILFSYDQNLDADGLNFFVVNAPDYRRLYRIARRCRRDAEPPGQAPILPEGVADVLWQNTIGYLEPPKLREIKRYGGRAKRGLLLLGPPGNGKTMACRWIWDECKRRGWDWRLVTANTYRQAKNNQCNPEEAVRNLFAFDKRGIVFFDDLDLALRNRERGYESEDQAIFLGAMDGIKVNEGVVFVFTSNCAPELIDRAFKRPGRLDVVLHFDAPDAGLRRQLMARWHPDLRDGIDLDHAVATSAGCSFAEIEELKNLVIIHYLDSGCWDWSWAKQQFAVNRSDLGDGRQRMGFLAAAVANGSN